MQYLMSRYGGHDVTFGEGKSSDSLLPEDQSIDYMLDNYATEIIPNYFFISSHDAKPEWMGQMKWHQFKRKPIKLGTLTHVFNDLLMQYEQTVTSDIYIGTHKYSNVFAIFIKTHKIGLDDIIPDYEEGYDYVLQVFIRSEQETIKLKDRPKDIERILTILFYKMDLIYEGDIKDFSPSKTIMGKLISKEFYDTISKSLIDVNSNKKLAHLIKQQPLSN